MGATRQFITSHYFAVVAILGIAGTALGLTLGFMLQGVFPILFRSLLPPNVTLVISPRAVAESLLLGIIVVGSFTFMPLYRLEELKPSFIFRKEIMPLQKGTPYYAAAAVILLFFMGLVLWQIRDLEVGLYFVGGVLGLVAISAGLTELTLRFLQRLHIKPLITRQALRGLFRPGNATRAIIITLATSLAVIFTIFLIERNLDASFIQSFPEDAPNVFFLDIQTDQKDAFAETLALETTYFPVVRGGITEINGEKIDRDVEDERDGDNLNRQFNLTYRDALMDGEGLLEGNALFRSDWEGAQVSLLDEFTANSRFSNWRYHYLPRTGRAA